MEKKRGDLINFNDQMNNEAPWKNANCFQQRRVIDNKNLNS